MGESAHNVARGDTTCAACVLQLDEQLNGRTITSSCGNLKWVGRVRGLAQ